MDKINFVCYNTKRGMNMLVIKCPKCGYEYTVSEIYLKDSLTGTTLLADRDSAGHIINIVGTEPDLNEEYVCDNCNTIFNIKADLSFTTTINEQDTLNIPYKTELE